MLCFYLFCSHKCSKSFSGHLLIVETNGLSLRWWMRMNKSGSGCVSSISVIYFLFQISSQMDFLCCPGDNSSPWQPSTPPAVIAWVYYYKEKRCSMYRTLSNAYVRITVCLFVCVCVCARVWNAHACYLGLSNNCKYSIVYVYYIHRVACFFFNWNLFEKFPTWCQVYHFMSLYTVNRSEDTALMKKNHPE